MSIPILDEFRALFAPNANNNEIPKKAPKDPLPERDKESEYWSGYEHSDRCKGSKLAYIEGADKIADFMVSKVKKYPVVFTTSKKWIIPDADSYHRYIEYCYCQGLINDEGDNYIRYQVVDQTDNWKTFRGIFAVRCGDCGKIAAGEFIGNPDMGDPLYSVYHRKNYFCQNFGWTYCGGHGYPGGRVMICPECSKKYADEARKGAEE